MLKTIAKWLILILLLAYATIATIWANHEAKKEKCVDVDIEIANSNLSNFITEEGVKNELGELNKNISKYFIKDINIDSLEHTLSADNRYENVECSWTNQRRLRINITPMIPEIRVFTSTGSYYINKDGKHISADINFMTDVPIVSGCFSETFRPTELLPVTRHIAQDSVLKNLISMVSANSRTNIILHSRIKGHVVNIGDTTNLPEKFDNLLLFYRQVMPYKGWDKYDTISLKYKGQIVAHHRNKAKPVADVNDNEEIDIEEASLTGQDMVVTGNEITN